MMLEFSLKENDYLQMQLFFFKDSGKLKKATIKFSLIASLIIAIIVIILSIYGNLFGALLISVALFIGPFFWASSVKEGYFNYFLKECKKNSNKIEQPRMLEITDNYINIHDIDRETKIMKDSFKRIIETTQHYFIAFNLEVLIIPKSKINSLALFKDELILFAEHHSITIENHLNWKW